MPSNVPIFSSRNPHWVQPTLVAFLYLQTAQRKEEPLRNVSPRRVYANCMMSSSHALTAVTFTLVLKPMPSRARTAATRPSIFPRCNTDATIGFDLQRRQPPANDGPRHETPNPPRYFDRTVDGTHASSGVNGTTKRWVGELLKDHGVKQQYDVGCVLSKALAFMLGEINLMDSLSVHHEQIW